MNAATRRGFSLIELLVSMVLLAVVASSVTTVTLSAVRTADRSRERARQQGILREVVSVVEREVGDISPSRDIGGFAAESITYRGARGSGYTCGVDGASVVVGDADYRAWRLPDSARDSLLVFLPGDSVAASATWVITPLHAPPTRGRCRDGSPGLRLSVDAAVVAGAAIADLPLRAFEWMRLKLYESGGSWWVGARSLRPGDVIQPIAGPLAVRGLSLSLLDGAARAAAPANATLLQVRLMAASPVASVGRRLAVDTLATTIALRNAGIP